jgi:hypothetical protein
MNPGREAVNLRAPAWQFGKIQVDNAIGDKEKTLEIETQAIKFKMSSF